MSQGTPGTPSLRQPTRSHPRQASSVAATFAARSRPPEEVRRRVWGRTFAGGGGAFTAGCLPALAARAPPRWAFAGGAGVGALPALALRPRSVVSAGAARFGGCLSELAARGRLTGSAWAAAFGLAAALGAETAR